MFHKPPRNLPYWTKIYLRVLWATSVERGEQKDLHGEFRERGPVNI